MIRLYETGISSKDIRFVIGITGLSPKSSKVLMDGRFTGHERHQGSDYRLPLAPKFDRSDRYVSRCNEIIDPCRIIHGTFHPRLMGPEEVKAGSTWPTPALTKGAEGELARFLSFDTTERSIVVPFISSPLTPCHRSLKLSIESTKGIYPIPINGFPY